MCESCCRCMGQAFDPYLWSATYGLCVGAGVGLALVVAIVLLTIGEKLGQWLRLFAVLVVLLGVVQGHAVEPRDPRLSADVPRELREYYRNPDGSCVQCSEGMAGVDQNVPAAWTLLWDSEYGPKERGGSGPERVASYARKRGLRVHNITGRPVYEWLEWATGNGRGAAVTCGASHMQYLMGRDKAAGKWYVCNNNSPERIDTYDDATFHRLCDSSGPWCVILDYPAHPERPVYRKWWDKPVHGQDLTQTALPLSGQLKPQLAQWQPRDLPKLPEAPEVNVKEIRRRGDLEQHLGDGIASHPVVDRFGECMSLPKNDADKWHIWCVVDPNGQRSRRLVAAWATSLDLRAFAVPGDPANSWAHFNVYNSDDGTQSWRWEKLQITASPSVFLQPPISKRYGDPSTVVFQAVYQDNPAELAASMREALINYLASVPQTVRPDIADPGQCPPNGPCPPFKPPLRPAPIVPDDNNVRPINPLVPLIPPPNGIPRPSLFDLLLSGVNVFAILSHVVMLLLAVALSVMTYRYLRYGSIWGVIVRGAGAKRKGKRRSP